MHTTARRFPSDPAQAAVRLICIAGLVLCLASCQGTVKQDENKPFLLPDTPGGVTGLRAVTPFTVSPGDVLDVSFVKNPFSGRTGDYRLGPADRLMIDLAGRTTYSREVTVQPDGKISFYKVGEINAAGKTLNELRTAMKEKLASVMPAADLTVILVQSQAAAAGFLSDLARDGGGASREVRVDPLGDIQLPLIGTVRVGWKTPADVAADIDGKYQAFFGKSLSSTVHVKATATRSIAVLGEVRSPGIYALAHSVHPVYALSMAGGPLDTGAAGSTFLLKPTADGKFNRHEIDLRLSRSNTFDTSLLIEPRDVLIVPKSGIANVNRWVDQYITRLLPFRIGAGASYMLNQQDD